MRNLKLIFEKRFKNKRDTQEICLPTTDQICVAQKNGQFTFQFTDLLKRYPPEFDEEGFFKAIKTSPDLEFTAAVNNDFQLIIYDYNFDPIKTIDLKDKDFGEGQFINVGWGKKETQFHGSEGKNAAKAKLLIENEESIQNDETIITWRGDGEFFVVGYKLVTTSQFKVFDREGVLQYTSEKQPGIECNFAWRPSGNLIATTQIFPNKYVVSFFEKNGLKHGEFELPFGIAEYKVKELSWSGDSEVLCVWCISTAKPHLSSLLLYTINNYHWYLKQSIRFKDDLSAITWDERGKYLYCVLNDGTVINYGWIFNVDCSKGKTINDKAIVGVIDGKKLNLTSFRKGVVPPPMSDISIVSASNINSIIFGPRTGNIVDSNNFIILRDDGNIEHYNSNYVLSGSCSLDIKGDKHPLTVPIINNNLSWVNENTLIVLMPQIEDSKIFKILKLVFEPTFEVQLVGNFHSVHEVIGITDYPDGSGAFLQTDSGAIFDVDLNGNVDENFGRSLTEYCYKFEAHKIENDTFLFGLSLRNRFYIDSEEIANNVNSFFVHSDFLLLTTFQHTLHCIKLNAQNISKTYNKKLLNLNDESKVYSRKLERGSRLVCAVSYDTRTILQLPRGNLECIQPRPLSLKIIGNYLDDYRYKEAFDLMRKQRINLNLMYDHNPSKFLENISTFVSKIDNASWLSLFISDLENQDVTVTMYPSSYENENSSKDNTTKIKDVCEKLREELEVQNANNKLLLPLLTIFVKLNNLEGVLSRIKEVREKNQKENGKSGISADEALKYLMYLVNVNKLYDVALGMYDFDLVLFVASKSQKDPKEYIPYLNELKALEENYRHFTIENELKNYESAVTKLAKCPERGDEFLNYVKKHSLYALALQCLDVEDSRYKVCAEEFGGYLHARRHYYEAGVLFRRSKNYNRSIESFSEAFDWQAALSVAEEMKISLEELSDLQRKLGNSLKQVKQYKNALNVLQYRNNINIDEVISCAIEGKLFKEAILLCNRHGKENMIDELVQPVVEEQYEFFTSLIDQNKEQYVQQKNRLEIVRKKKVEMPNNQRDGYMPDCDLYSDTSSVISSNDSRSSGRSFRSSKNRRKHERKLVSLKEGSKFEDVALIRSLHNLITTTFSMRNDAYELNSVMQWLKMDIQVAKLQHMLENVLRIMKNGFQEIWTTDLVTEANKGDVNDNAGLGDVNDASCTLEPHIRISPVIQDIKWKLELIS